MTAPVEQATTVGGSLEGGVTIPQHTPPSEVPGVKTLKFERLYCHYILKTGAEISTPNITLRSGFAGTVQALEHSEGLHFVPYDNVGIACTQGQYALDISTATRVQLLDLGYSVERIMFYEQTLGTLAGTTVVRNTVDNNPILMKFEDNKHYFDDIVGYRGGTTVASAGCRFGRPNVGRPSFAGVNSQGVSSTDPAFFAMQQWPADRTKGQLRNVSLYSTKSDPIRLSDNNPLSMADYLPYTVHQNGDVWKHHWKNPRPFWLAVSRPTWDIATVSSAANPTVTGIANPTLGGWPRSRAAALEQCWAGTMMPYTNDMLSRTFPLVAGTANSYDFQGEGITETMDWRPPAHYLKIPPLLTQSDIEMEYVCQLWIRYQMTLKLDYNGRPVDSVIQSATWPSGSPGPNAVYITYKPIFDSGSVGGSNVQEWQRTFS